MTHLIVFFFSVLANFAQAQISPTTSQAVLGIPNGTYYGEGTLITSGLPDPSFTSTRSLDNGIITANSVATLLGKPITVIAELQVIPLEKNSGAFNLKDLTNNKIVGTGTCILEECSFEANVMDNQLTLSETWVFDAPNKFIVAIGKQKIFGITSTYDGTIFNSNF